MIDVEMAELLVTLLADSTVVGKDLKSVMKSVAHLVVILVGSLGCSMTVEPLVISWMCVALLGVNSRRLSCWYSRRLHSWLKRSRMKRWTIRRLRIWMSRWLKA